MMEVRRVTGLVINAPEFFRDQEFMSWLNAQETIMSWHKKGQSAADEWSDTVVLVDPGLSGEGAGSDMPERIWDLIVQSCKDAGLTDQREHIPVRLTNIN